MQIIEVVTAALPTIDNASQWRMKEMGDFDNDGDMDLFWVNEVTGDNGFWEMDGTKYVMITMAASTLFGTTKRQVKQHSGKSVR